MWITQSPIRWPAPPFDTKCVVRAQVYEKHAPVRVKGGRLMARVMAGDETAGLVLTYFNTRYAPQKLEAGRSYLFFGKVAGSFSQREMVNPTVVSPAEASATPFVPVYPQTEGLNSRNIQKYVRAAFEAMPHIQDPLPAWMVEKYRLCSKAQAVRSMHFPARHGRGACGAQAADLRRTSGASAGAFAFARARGCAHRRADA